MSEIYTVIVVILGILAVSGLFVGVTNDAVNFLNSAIGSKAASMRTILAVASVGIIIGVVTSSGMMEVARSGMFNPGLFTFHEVMILYLGVMFANIILLDLYNSLGLPTSTTVSLIFCLLGSAIAVSIFKISSDPAIGFSSLGTFINSSRALGIVSAILLSVVIAFTCGTISMYISRTIFSFRYTAMLRRFGAFWCGASLTAILYFALFKGLKSLMAGHPLVLWFIQLFKVNILRITILSGTFALALAFAGNDLVNFIGVPVAAFDSYRIATAAGDSSMLMEALNENIPANMSILLFAGGIMLLTLWTSKKAMHVSQTELKLAASQEEDSTAQNNSSVFSRTIVRAAMMINNAFEYITPKPLRERIERRFEFEDIEHSGAPFDMIRATVNLTTSALLIALATSLKLPLSTTYVCFMVAMGSSLADRAWGRESAVYRISGVITVVMGWFVTALGGFIIAFAVGLILIYGGTIAFIVVTALCGYMLIRSNFKKKEVEHEEEHQAETKEDLIRELRDEVGHTMLRASKIYDRTLLATMRENRGELQAMVKEANQLFYQSRDRKYALMPTLKKLQSGDIYAAHYYVQVVDYLNEVAKALLHIARPAFDHIDNCHEGFTTDETRDLMAINDEVEMINRRINTMLREGDFAEIETVMVMRDGLFERISEAMIAELSRIDAQQTSTRASMLYLTILSETKNMVLQSRNLIKSQQYFLQHREEPKQWIKK